MTSTSGIDAVELLPGHVLERPRVAERAELAALVRDCDVAAVGFADFTEDDVQEWLDAPFTRPDEDGWTVRDAMGRLVAWAYLENHYDTRAEDGQVYVHPTAERGLHDRLVGLLVSRSGQRAANAGRSGHQLVFWCTDEPELVSAVTRAGARKARTFARMRRDLDGTEGQLPAPAGIELVEGVDPADEPLMRAFHDAYVAAFAGHYSFEPSTFEAWRDHVAASPVVPYDQWIVARRDGTVVGVMQAADMSEDGGGWVRNLGVRPAERGRGIARVLLDRAFAIFRARGCTWAGLGVDVGNETGAFRLYESVGMRVLFRADAHELTVPAAQG